MNEHAFCSSFAGTHHVDVPVAIEICEYRIFGRADLSHGDGGPFLFRFCMSGVEIGANDSSFLPAGGDVHKTVAINIGKANAVGSHGAVIDGVTFPRLRSVGSQLERHKEECRFHGNRI